MNEDRNAGIDGFEADLRRTSEELTAHENTEDFGAMVRRSVERYWRERQLFEEVARTVPSHAATVGEAVQFAEDLRRTREELRGDNAVDFGEVVSKAASKYWQSRSELVEDDEPDPRGELVSAMAGMLRSVIPPIDAAAAGELAMEEPSVISTMDAFRHFAVMFFGIFIVGLMVSWAVVSLMHMPRTAEVWAPFQAVAYDSSYALFSLVLVAACTFIIAALFIKPLLRPWAGGSGAITAMMLLAMFIVAYKDVAKDFANARTQLNDVISGYMRDQSHRLQIPQAYLVKHCPTSSDKVERLCASPEGMRGQLVANVSPDKAHVSWLVGENDLLQVTLLPCVVVKVEDDHVVVRSGRDTFTAPLTDRTRSVVPGEQLLLQLMPDQPSEILPESMYAVTRR